MLLEAKELSVYYGTVQALNNISIEVNEGEIVSLIGPNGAGKSTALNAICGLLRKTGGEIQSGDVIFMGESVKNLLPHDLVRKGISLVPEGRRVFPTMSVLENLEMGGYIQNDKKAKQEALEKIIQTFPNPRRKTKAKSGNTVEWGTTDASHRKGSYAQAKTALTR